MLLTSAPAAPAAPAAPSSPAGDLAQVAQVAQAEWEGPQTTWECHSLNGYYQWLPMLVGGLEHSLFFHILGTIIPTDEYFSEGFKPPTRMGMTGSWWSMVIDGY